jgi:disulfide bond formation protein DsbB
MSVPLFDVRLIHKTVFVLSTVAWGFSIGAQFFFSEMPCELCLIARFGFVGLSVFSFVATIFTISFFRKIIFLSCSFLLIFSFYHLGVENAWWSGPSSCSVKVLSPEEVENLSKDEKLEIAKNNIFNEKKPRCDKVNLRIFGLSSTLYSFLISAGLFWLISVSYLLDIQEHRREKGKRPNRPPLF